MSYIPLFCDTAIYVAILLLGSVMLLVYPHQCTFTFNKKHDYQLYSDPLPSHRKIFGIIFTCHINLGCIRLGDCRVYTSFNHVVRFTSSFLNFECPTVPRIDSTILRDCFWSRIFLKPLAKSSVLPFVTMRQGDSISSFWMQNHCTSCIYDIKKLFRRKGDQDYNLISVLSGPGGISSNGINLYLELHKVDLKHKFWGYILIVF